MEYSLDELKKILEEAKSDNGASPIDKILDPDNTDPIVLYDENNKETEFEQVAVIPLYEKVYVLLKPITKIAGVGEDEALVFVIEEIDDEDALVIVEDADVVNAVFDEYYKLLDEDDGE